MNKRASRRRLLSASGILTACILGLLPAGCGDSAASDKHVQKAANEAARIAGSAGASRPTDKLTAEVKEAGWQGDKQAALNTKLLAPAKAAM